MRAILAMLGLMLASLLFALVLTASGASEMSLKEYPGFPPTDEEEAAFPAPRGLGPRVVPDETLVLDAPESR